MAQFFSDDRSTAGNHLRLKVMTNQVAESDRVTQAIFSPVHSEKCTLDRVLALDSLCPTVNFRSLI